MKHFFWLSVFVSKLPDMGSCADNGTERIHRRQKSRAAPDIRSADNFGIDPCKLKRRRRTDPLFAAGGLYYKGAVP